MVFFVSKWIQRMHWGRWVSIMSVQKQSPEVFCKKGAFKNSANFTGKHLCWSPFLNSNTSCFPVKFEKFLRTPILKNICKRLLLSVLKLKQLQILFNNVGSFIHYKTLKTKCLARFTHNYMENCNNFPFLGNCYDHKIS